MAAPPCTEAIGYTLHGAHEDIATVVSLALGLLGGRALLRFLGP
eukprot:CAMPEP_0179339384 /NCGR_PEP_ID=MMETSP0797-20121207/68684_1 /TAXON_ID=47934 /ORGANISM="Dinophysis acuminata, Strain DAEP01" /LENGTH=43 /DNA_ID= /DNA_START= /DNA_END= /DNA_ORIENTATION=